MEQNNELNVCYPTETQEHQQVDVFDLVQPGKEKELADYVLSQPSAAQACTDWGKTLLMEALEHHSSQAVALLLQSPEINLDACLQEELFTALHIAVLANNKQGVKQLLAAGCQPNKIDYEGMTPLMHAAQKGFIEIFKLLLEKADLSINQVSGNLGSVLHIVCRTGTKDFLSLLLKSPDLNINIEQPSSGGTSLMTAVDHGYHALVKMLLNDSRINPNAADHHNETPLMRALQKGHLDIAMTLMAHPGLNVFFQRNIDNDSAPLIALHHLTAIQAMKDLPDFDINRPEKFGKNLFHSSIGESIEVFQELLCCSGLDLNARDSFGNTALISSCCEENPEFALNLLDFRLLHTTTKNQLGKSALDYAAEHSCPEVTEKLLIKSSSLPQQEQRLETALSIALYHKRYDNMAVLIKHGANPYQAILEGLPLFEYAALCGDFIAEKILSGDNPNALCFSHQSPQQLSGTKRSRAGKISARSS